MEPEVLNRPGQVEVQDSRLDPRRSRRGINFEDAIEMRGHDDHRSTDRRGTTRQPGTAAAGDERTLVACGHGDDRRHLFAVRREADRRRLTALDTRVTGIQRELERLGSGPLGTDRRAKVGEQRAFRVDVRRLPASVDTLGHPFDIPRSLDGQPHP